MKKIMFFILSALTLMGGVSFADVQIDEGQSKSVAPIKFMVARYARTGAVATAGAHEISKDSVVVWDSTSRDGVTVTTSTTSNDGLVAGVAMDLIPGSSRDNTALNDEAKNNWGRIQVWGLRQDVRWANHSLQGGVQPSAGARVGTSGTAQSLGIYHEVANAGNNGEHVNTSKDSLGVLLEQPTAGDTIVDIFINRG